MKRDGYLESIWQSTLPDFEPRNSWSPDTTYDVLIAGGGITGLTTALLLQKAGLQCILAEAHNIGYGTTSGTTAHLNTLLDTPYHTIEKNFGEEAARLMANASREAIDLIETLVDEYDIDCNFSYQSGYVFAQQPAEEEELDIMIDAAEKAGVVVSHSANIPVPLPFTKALRFEFQAQLHPAKYLVALANAFEAAGGVILQHCPVQQVTENEVITAATALGTIQAHHVVYATHIPPGLNLLHLRCAPYRSYAMAFRLNNDAYPEGLAYDMKDPYNYFRAHEVNGQKYVICGGFDHKTGHHKHTDHVFTELEAFARSYYDIASIDFKWSSQYYNSVDGLPYIGLMPGHDRIYTATGYAGNGLVLGTLAGRMLCDILTGKGSPYEDLLRPGRIKPIAGFADFVKENADVVSQFIGKRFAYEKISSLADIAKGEATLAEWEGKKVALYKDDSGKVKALDPVCPHAKCVVTWNSAEKSWDCPCHGARYAPDGELITGPARHNLTPLLWEEMDGD